MKVKFAFLALAVAATVATGCSKEDPTAVNVATRATITGLVRGNVDLSNDYRVEVVEVSPGAFMNDTIPEITLEPLEGVRIFGRYNTANLTSIVDQNHTYADVIVEALTDADGRYTLLIPAGAKAVPVQMSGTELEVDRIEADGTTERKQFTTGTPSVSVTQNVTRVVDLQYNAN